MKYIATLTVLAVAAVVGLAACGGGGGTQTAPSAGHSTSPAPAPAGVHTAQPGEPALVAVPGYDYAHVPAGGPNAKKLLQSDPEHLKAASAHVVLHHANMIAALDDYAEAYLQATHA